MFLEKKTLSPCTESENSSNCVLDLFSSLSISPHTLISTLVYVPKNTKQNETTQSQSNINFGLVQHMSSSTLFIYKSLYAI